MQAAYLAIFNTKIFTQIIYTAHKQLTRMLSQAICWTKWKIQKHFSNSRKKVQEIELSENYFKNNLTLNYLDFLFGSKGIINR